MTDTKVGGASRVSVRLAKGNRTINSVQGWFDVAPPKRGALHWKNCRSAKELARAWCLDEGTIRVPTELLTLLQDFGVADIDVIGEPEAQVPIDTFLGEPPNLDLALTFATPDGPLAVGVEAKADESFGNLVEKVLLKSACRIAIDKSSNAAARVQKLAKALLPRWVDGLPHVGELRYQLLTGVAGTLAYARQQRANRTVFVVHEFICHKHTAESKLRRNQEDLDRFISRMTANSVNRVNVGQLVGPIHVPGSDHLLSTVKLFLGRICTELESVSCHQTAPSQ